MATRTTAPGYTLTVHVCLHHEPVANTIRTFRRGVGKRGACKAASQDGHGLRGKRLPILGICKTKQDVYDKSVSMGFVLTPPETTLFGPRDEGVDIQDFWAVPMLLGFAFKMRSRA